MENTPDRKLTDTRMFYSRLPETPGFTMLFTPLIDVFFLLLIFITLGAGVVYSKGIVIEPPIVDDVDYEYADKLVISLKAIQDETQTYLNTQIFFNDRTVHDYSTLENQLKELLGDVAKTVGPQKARRPVVMLRADQNVPSNDIAQVMSICRKNNVRLFITTKQR